MALAIGGTNGIGRCAAEIYADEAQNVAVCAGEEAVPAKKSRPGPARAPEGPSAPRPRKTRETKPAALVALLGRAEGRTIADAVASLGWQPHTVRGAFAGALKKRLGSPTPRRSSAAAGSTGLEPDTNSA